jgi:3-phosphoshikimate 1-carboxyvinyltransferase
MKKIIIPGKYSGEINVPSSKSDGQRALLAALLCQEETELINLGESNDEKDLLNAIQELGAQIISEVENSLTIKGIKNIAENKTISIGESGLASRLIISASALFDKQITIQGTGSILNRPMDFFVETLPKFGVTVKSNEGKLPISIKGPLLGNEINIEVNLSSQFLSGLLMSLPLSPKNSVIKVEKLTSRPYVEMTLETLSKFGINIETSKDNFTDIFKIEGNQRYQSIPYQIENDWSSASYWIIAAALGQKLELKGLNSTSFQADIAILKALKNANCEISGLEENALTINGEKRTSFTFDATHCPDLFPALAVFALFCVGKTEIKGVSRLVHKESNRGQVLQQEFSKLGAKIEIKDDFMFIEGIKQIKGGITLDSHHDHRIAMSLGILGMFAELPITIENSEAVAKSYPAFWEDLEKLKK